MDSNFLLKNMSLLELYDVEIWKSKFFDNKFWGMVPFF
jgi:hypothetical protein